MNTVNKFLILILLTTVPLANAAVGGGGGDEVLNGGAVVQCKSGVQLLDFEESPFPLKKFSEQKYQDILKTVLNELKEKMPELADQYTRQTADFENKSEFKAQKTLSEIKDRGDYSFPKGCTVEQAAYRRKKPLLGQKNFVVSQDLWEKLNPADKAGLVVHEIVNQHFADLGEANSRKARNFVALLFSEKLQTLSKTDLRQYFQDMKVPIYQ